MPHGTLFPATVMPDKEWWQALWPEPGEVLRAVGIEPGMQVVDLCCGDGYFTRPLCDLTHPGGTFALDLDARLLNQAERACRDHDNFHAILGDARDLPALLGESVDFVFIANTFHGVPDKTALAQAISRALKPGGRFAVINWHRRPREQTSVLGQPRGPDTDLRMTPEAVRQVVEPAGFRLGRIVDVSPYHYGAVLVKTNGKEKDIGARRGGGAKKKGKAVRSGK